MIKCIAAVGVMTVAGSAFGMTISQTQPFGTANPTYSTPLNFNQFDDMGGTLTLTSVQVILSLDVDGGSATIDNDGADAGTGDLGLGATGSVSSGDVGLITAAAIPFDLESTASTMWMGPLAGNDGDGNGAQNGGPDEFTLLGAAANAGDNDFVGAAFFGGYIGAGSYTIDVDVEGFLNISSPDTSVEGSFSPVFAGGEVTVIYNFTPAPGAAVLLGAAGLIGLRRRR